MRPTIPPLHTKPRVAGRRNCWTCALSGPRRAECDALTLDEDADAPVLAWLDAAPMATDGTVPHDADNCPAWRTP